MKRYFRRKLASLLSWALQPFLLGFSWQIAKHFAERDKAIDALIAESHEIDALFVRSIKRLDARVSKLEGDWSKTVERYIREGRTVSGGCGASQEQKDIGQQQTAFMQQMMGQAQEIFGNSSSVFKDLVNTYAPTVAAGPNQKGFSLPEEAALKSQAITQTGEAYKHASQAVKQANAAVGGGNDALPGGADIGRNIDVANAGAAQTSSELNQIDQANYATGRQNYDFATTGLANAPNVFGVANKPGKLRRTPETQRQTRLTRSASRTTHGFQPLRGR